MVLLETVVAVICAAAAGVYAFMMRGGKGNKKAGDRNPKGYAKKKSGCASWR